MVSASDLARSVIRQLIENGIQDFVLSPGSRNAPLSIALNEAAEKGLINLHVRIDERSAAFFALGISKASDRYVAVICTSGTAVANYHPAALEAYHSSNKIIFLTADRPARLRRTGANQTTIQDGILSPVQSIDTAEIVDVEKLLNRGPIHLNMQFDEPLLENDSHEWLSGLQIQSNNYPSLIKGKLVVKPRSIVIIGHDAGGFSPESVFGAIENSQLPIISEDPLSFPTAIPHAALFLADASLRESLKADQLIVIGRTTLSRSINAFIAQTPNVVVIDPRIENIDIHREATQILFELPQLSVGEVDKTWIELWQGVAHRASEAVELDWSEQLFLRELCRLLPDGSALFVGSSRPVRDIEAFATPRKSLHVFANRGLAGIDGNISTAQGISTQYERTYSVIGDLTFIHDLGALVNFSEIEKTNHTIFVIDNNGGGIFSTLPQSGVAGFEKVFGTPQNIDLESVIRGFGYSVEKIKSTGDIQINVNHQGFRFVLVEVPDREKNALRLKEIHQRVASAVRIGNNLA
jgi:2-succinyl-5-enolpyruvyl-6-hydroxy-3-cyclohexene-1-carboxylate synthase